MTEHIITTEPNETNGSKGPMEAETTTVDNLTSTPPIEDSVPSTGRSLPEDVSPRTRTFTSFDVEMDSLAQRLEGVNIMDLAPKESRSIRVPPDYRLELQVSPTRFFKLRNDEKKSNKRKREQGLISKSYDAEVFYGFRPEHLLWYGALSLKDCKPSNLSNDVHPLLHHSRFDDCPDTIYDELLPGLRLATMFLTQPICSQFWLTLANGERKTDPTQTWLNRVNCQRIEKNITMTKENTASVIEYIKQLDRANVIHWSFQHDLVVHDLTAYGATKWVCDNHDELPRGPNNKLVPQHIRIHADMYTVATKYSRLEYADTAQKLRFSFFVAVLFCHELAHAVEGVHRRTRPLGADLHIEPWLFNHEIAEMGRAWESITLGGTVQPINAASDCCHGIGTWDWPEVDPMVNFSRSLKYTVPMSYIESLFQMETWQRDYNLENWKTFHIPRDGAISLNLNNLTTTPWSEENRVAREELQESVNAADPDEPAAKKREIAIGQAVVSSARFGEELESIEQVTKAPPLVHSIQEQERIIRQPTRKNKKRQRNKKRAEGSATDINRLVPNKEDEKGTEQTAEGVKLTTYPESPTKVNENGEETAMETGVGVEKNQAELQNAKETEASPMAEEQNSEAEKQPYPAQEQPVPSKEKSPAGESTPAATKELTVSASASLAEQPMATEAHFNSKTPSPGIQEAILPLTEPADTPPAVIVKQGTLTTLPNSLTKTRLTP